MQLSPRLYKILYHLYQQQDIFCTFRYWSSCLYSKLSVLKLSHVFSLFCPTSHISSNISSNLKSIWYGTGRCCGLCYSNLLSFKLCPATSVANPGCWPRNPDPTFRSLIQDPGSRVDTIPDPGSGSASKNLIIFNQKIYYLVKNKIRDVHLEFISDPVIWIMGLDFFHPPQIPRGVK
jgi:hypothetical protein